LARPKKVKQRRKPESIAHTLDEIESTGDRIAEWISENPKLILGSVLAIALIGGTYSLISSTQETAREEASAALSSVQADYRKAMGASPDDVEVSDPANPETAQRVREEYIERFGEVATEHPGTAGAALAGLEIGLLEQALGRSDDALATWLEAANTLGPNDTLGALIELRVAAAHEAAGRWLEAGEALERAASVESFPLRHTARAEAARCYAEGGEVDRALSAFAQARASDPDGFLPEHLSARLLELQAAQRLQ
jgi:tetratricopeptide (TPR) repeat protein